MKRDALFIKLTYLNIILLVVQFLSMVFVTLKFIPFNYTSYFNLLLTIYIISIIISIKSCTSNANAMFWL
jgi:hypothetical protein